MLKATRGKLFSNSGLQKIPPVTTINRLHPAFISHYANKARKWQKNGKQKW